jgi:SAM-dependent methyltransferase
MSKLLSGLRILREHGLMYTLNYARLWLSECRNDRHFGIDTRGYIELEACGIHNAECHSYTPASYVGVKLALNLALPTSEDEVFIDFGAGKGRVVIVAATYAFSRVIGVEIASELAAEARENITRARHRLTCTDVTILEADATSYHIPPQATVLHFYNPFRGEALSRVVANICKSLQEAPRRATIMFCNADHFEQILRERSPIPAAWIKSTETIPIPLHEHPSAFGNKYRIYRLDSR